MSPNQTVVQTISDYYRVPEGLLGRVLAAKPSGATGFFRFGPDVICYGQCSSGVSAKVEYSRRTSLTFHGLLE